MMTNKSTVDSFEPQEVWYQLVAVDRTVLKTKAMTKEEAARRNENVRELGYTWVRGGCNTKSN